MATVKFNFVLPDDPRITAIRIYESSHHEGPWGIIETVTAIGTYPDFITTYTTDEAINAYDWFSLSTINDVGVESTLSDPQRIIDTSLVDVITDRVQSRGVAVDEVVIRQEAEAVIEQYFRANPYSIDPSTVSFQVQSGLTYLTMARLLIGQLSTGESSSWVAGLVSMKQGSTSEDSIEALLTLAGQLLGFGFSVVARMATPEIAGGLSKVIEYNISRLQVTSIE